MEEKILNGPAATLPEDPVARIVEGVDLDVSADPQRLRVPAYQRSVGRPPVVLELLSGQVGKPTKAVDELDHDRPPFGSILPR